MRKSPVDVFSTDRSDYDIALFEGLLDFCEVLRGVDIENGYVEIDSLVSQVAGSEHRSEVEVKIVGVRGAVCRKGQQKRYVDFVYIVIDEVGPCGEDVFFADDYYSRVFGSD